MGHFKPLQRNGKNFRCYLCGEWFDKYTYLEKHLQEVHNIENPQ